MRTLISLFAFLVVIFIYNSCESENNSTNNQGFRLKFSDGSEIVEKDIVFYDSSAHLLFLKHDFAFNDSMPDFYAIVDNDTIYQGVMHLCFLSRMPLKPIFITDCYHYGNNIIEIDCYSEKDDLRNDPRIINALAEKGLLRNGLSCRIDSISINSSGNHSDVDCSITVRNHDNIAYYIPDPAKTGSLKFMYYTGGVSFYETHTHMNYFLRWTDTEPDWYILTMSDLTLLQGNSEISFTFGSSDYDKIPAGLYTAYFRFYGLQNNTSGVDLNQPGGRIWVGGVKAKIDSLVVE